MSETGAEIPALSEGELSGDSLSVYAKLLGLPERRYPRMDEFPRNVFLPAGTLGSLEESILTTNQDGRERAQLISWDKSQKTFREGKVFVGTRYDTGYVHQLHNLLSVYFRQKGILFYHTHPSHVGLPLFSEGDISAAKMYPRMGFMFAVGTIRGVSFLFQTERSSKLPLFAAGRSVITSFELMKKTDHLGYLYQQGYGYYIWSPPEGILRRGDMREGINLLRRDPGEELFLLRSGSF